MRGLRTLRRLLSNRWRALAEQLYLQTLENLLTRYNSLLQVESQKLRLGTWEGLRDFERNQVQTLKEVGEG